MTPCVSPNEEVMEDNLRDLQHNIEVHKTNGKGNAEKK